jgi:hypothetical protein
MPLPGRHRFLIPLRNMLDGFMFSRWSTPKKPELSCTCQMKKLNAICPCYPHQFMDRSNQTRVFLEIFNVPGGQVFIDILCIRANSRLPPVACGPIPYAAGLADGTPHPEFALG